MQHAAPLCRATGAFEPARTLAWSVSRTAARAGNRRDVAAVSSCRSDYRPGLDGLAPPCRRYAGRMVGGAYRPARVTAMAINRARRATTAQCSSGLGRACPKPTRGRSSGCTFSPPAIGAVGVFVDDRRPSIGESSRIPVHRHVAKCAQRFRQPLADMRTIPCGGITFRRRRVIERVPVAESLGVGHLQFECVALAMLEPGHLD